MPFGTLSPANLVVVRLTRKYAEMINGVDLTSCEVGDILRLSPRDAALLIAEGWAAPYGPRLHENVARS
jgi:hypothetical protein